jgi:Trk-type K+ transport system membrane component
MRNVLLIVPARAVIVAICEVVTAETEALKPILEALAETVTALGTVTAPLSLDRFTLSLLFVGPVK